MRVVDQDLVDRLRIHEEELAAVEKREQAELSRRVAQLRGVREAIPLAGRPVVIVDDGIATGATARAACLVARARGASRVLLATPVAPPGMTDQFRDVADDVVCLATPQGFIGIGEFFEDFRQVTDQQVRELLRRTRVPAGAIDPPTVDDDPSGRDEEVAIEVPNATLAGHLTVPADAPGVVVFVHGSGSSRHSPRNQQVASMLNQAGLGTLLFDLLTPDEAHDRRNVFDIELLAQRLAVVTTWLRTWLRTGYASTTRVGYFGASTGAAAALVAAAQPGNDVAAVVSRGGRPDLAGPALGDVRGAHTADRGRQRRVRTRTQPRGATAIEVRQSARGGAGRESPVRGGRRADQGGRVGGAVVRPEHRQPPLDFGVLPLEVCRTSRGGTRCPKAMREFPVSICVCPARGRSFSGI